MGQKCAIRPQCFSKGLGVKAISVVLRLTFAERDTRVGIRPAMLDEMWNCASDRNGLA